MAATVELIDPSKIEPNPDNPRLIFRLQELEELETSIAGQGILVPLTLFRDGKRYVLLDGERRWRCARKLGLHRVPVIIQPKPERIQNIMMMFAIHNARRDWDPLPTALKMEQLEKELSKARGKKLNEAELAAAASLTRGAVRRYRKILRIPKDIQEHLLENLDDASNPNSLSVDQVIEAVDAADDLVEAKIVGASDARSVIDHVIEKFENRTISNTVEPRKIGKIARSVTAGDLPLTTARASIRRFLSRKTMTIAALVSETIERGEHQKSVERGLKTFEEKWLPELESHTDLASDFKDRIKALIKRLQALV
jgi:ParB family transcriptional regulator, chromosome partitioning protein